MKKILLIITALVFSSGLMAQEDYSQTPVREGIRNSKNRQVQTEVGMGAGFWNGGNSDYVSTGIGFQPAERWRFSAGFGLMYSNFKAPVFSSYNETPDYQNLRAITNFYKASASYLASERLLLTGSIIYGQNRVTTPGTRYSSSNDAYMCTFGATFKISPSLSIGVEVSRSQNMYPYYDYGYGDPYHRF